MTHQPSHATLLPSAADVIVRQLAACGIDYVFANGGTDFPPIVEAYAQAQERGEDFPQPMVRQLHQLACNLRGDAKDRVLSRLDDSISLCRLS